MATRHRDVNFFRLATESGGTEDVQGLDRSQEQTLTTEQVLQLATVGLLLEKEYASPRDTEWAFHQVSAQWCKQKYFFSVILEQCVICCKSNLSAGIISFEQF